MKTTQACCDHNILSQQREEQSQRRSGERTLKTKRNQVVRGGAKQGPKHLGDNGFGTVKTAAITPVSEIQPGIQSMKNLTLSVQRNGICGCGHKRGDGDGVTAKLPHIHAQKCHEPIL